MSSPRRLMLTVLVCFLVSFSLASVLHHGKGPCLDGEKGTRKEGAVAKLKKIQDEKSESTFAQLLLSASPDTLHKLLHAYFPDRYQHGVYPSDHDALAAVHRDNPPLATTLAKLARRQNGGTNSTSSDSQKPPDPTPDPSPSDTGTNSDTNPSQTNPGDNPSANSNPPTNNTPIPTPTDEPDTPGTSPQAEPSVEPPDEPSDEPPTSLSLSDSPSPSPSPFLSEPSQSNPDEDSFSVIKTSPSLTLSFPASTEAPDSPKQTTAPKITRTPSKSASAITMTSTLPDGRLTTITSTSYYDVYPAEETDPVESPSLQNVGSRLSSESLLSALLGIAVGGFLVV